MAVEFVCDGCGKRAPGIAGHLGWVKPQGWFQRQDYAPPRKIQDACSRECVKSASEKAGTSPAVSPF